ncbi:hypothetical protein AWC19_25555 [Mycobacterium palustre]|uniref:Uncharacterized protein n=2 Tax=Mycobacterium palustre TaxID=153971 RepID=A0A1X1ZYH9_9MYCO|nr:hypothetical protein AWC19_25555 [Mycobacterium palustre]
MGLRDELSKHEDFEAQREAERIENVRKVEELIAEFVQLAKERGIPPTDSYNGFTGWIVEPKELDRLGISVHGDTKAHDYTGWSPISAAEILDKIYYVHTLERALTWRLSRS